MKLRHKCIIGVTAISMLFAMPSSFAAEDDVVIFGNEFDDKTESQKNKVSSTPVNKPITTEDNSKEDIKENNENHYEDSTNVDSDENSVSIEEIPDDISTNDLNNENIVVDDYEIGEIIKFNEIKNDNNIFDENLNQIENSNFENIDSIPENIIDNIDDDSLYLEKNDNYNTKEDRKDDIIIPNLSSTNDVTNNKINHFEEKNNHTDDSQRNQKKIKARFIKLLSDDTYDYYLDRNTVRWISIPYSTSEYMADIWIRMIEKNQTKDENMPSDLYDYVNEIDDEITDAAAKGIVYDEVDVKVLRTKKYFLEHYYIRPKTEQIQFLCELEVVGRPQNAISERTYDYKNWESLIPGSIEFSIYHGVLSNIGKGKASKRGHMTVVDMIDEYARIALN